MLKLTSYKVEELENSEIHWKTDLITFDNYNLIIGKNASGKSQLFQRFNFLKLVHSKDGLTPNIRTTIDFLLTFKDTENDNIIKYNLKVMPNQEVEETVENETLKITLYSSNKKAFYDELKNNEVSLLFPKKHSVTKFISDMEGNFPTLKKIGDFFDGVKLLRTDRYNPHHLSPTLGQMVPDENLNNLGAVVLTWKQQNKALFNELLNTYKTFFEGINDLISVPQPNLPIPILGFSEKNVKWTVSQTDCSMGMLRILGIIALSISVDPKTGKIPSLIIVDEIDNGLDYENVGAIIEYLIERSSQSQVIFSSHSPVVCNFVTPKNWRVFSRKGSHVQVKVPTETKETLDLIKSSKMSNWEIYQNHISKSNLYVVH